MFSLREFLLGGGGAAAVASTRAVLLECSPNASRFRADDETD